MKAYITCPVTLTNKRIDFLPEVEKIVKSKDLETFVIIAGGTPKEIFNRDYNQIKSSDLIIAEVSEPSHGVGMEIGMSFSLGLKRILLFQKGSVVTKLAQGMPDTFIVEYEELEDLKNNLNKTLDKLLS